MDSLIEISNLYKSFGTNKVLNGINLKVNKGDALVILGRSGSGKSVAIKCIVGLIKPEKGSIKVFDTDITTLHIEEQNDYENN